MTDNFSRNLLLSGVGHALIVLLIFFRAVTAPQERIDIRNAIRVDVVGLPEKSATLPEKPAPHVPAPPEPKAAAPEPKAAKESKPEPVTEKAKPTPTLNLQKSVKPNTEKSQKNAIDKLKALEALERIKKEVGKVKQAEQRAKPQDVVRGNQIAAGNALSGLEKIEYDRYFDELEGKIRAQWSIPQWLADGDFRAQVLILVDERGYVTKKIFRKTSGNDIFDSKVLEAIDASSPLPVPPARLKGVLSTSGIVLNFPQ